MELVFNITVTPDYPHDLRSSHTFKQAGGTIGRSEKCDWPLPDNKRHLSGVHAEVTFEEGRFYLTDLSTNGTFVGNSRDDASKERLPARQPVPIVHGTSYIFGEYQLQARLIQDLALYQDTDVRPLTDDNIIPDDDFLDLDPLKALDQQNQQHGSSLPDDWLGSGLTEGDTSMDSLDQMADVVPAPAFATANETPEASATSTPTDTPDPAPAEPVSEADWHRLSAALGIDLAHIAAAERGAVLTRLGKMLRLAVTGTMHGLRTRADIKNEMRLTMTVVQSEGNNPLKFCSDYQQAMELMLKPGPGYLPGEQALRQGMQELQAHQVASLAATRSAISGVIEQLSPEQLVYRFEQTISQPRFGKADGRYWRAYQQFHQSMSDDQHWRQSLFSRHYAKTYEEQAQLLSTANPHID